MIENPFSESDALSSAPTPDEVDQALQAFQRGSPDEFDRLLDGDRQGGPGICALLASLVHESARYRIEMKGR